MKKIMHLNIKHLKDLTSISAKLDTISISLFEHNLHREKKNTGHSSEILDNKIK